MQSIETERLIMRTWQETDLDDFAAMNQDARIMEYFPFQLTREETAAMIRVFQERMQDKRFYYLALVEKEIECFVGMVILAPVTFEAHFTPAVEIGWRLAYEHWGKGYATEAARGLLDFGFSTLKLKEIVSFTAVENKRSSAVMKRLGMTPDGEFDHPGLLEGDALRRHALYRISKTGPE